MSYTSLYSYVLISVQRYNIESNSYEIESEKLSTFSVVKLMNAHYLFRNKSSSIRNFNGNYILATTLSGLLLTTQIQFILVNEQLFLPKCNVNRKVM